MIFGPASCYEESARAIHIWIFRGNRGGRERSCFWMTATITGLRSASALPKNAGTMIAKHHEAQGAFAIGLLHQTAIPSEYGRILDIAPLNEEIRSIWLVLAADGRLFRLLADSGESELITRVDIPSETAKDPFNGHTLAPRLHAAPNGQFAAVVNDYGRYGRIIDLRSGNVTMQLDGGEYCCDTVPFSFAFVCRRGQVVAIHRTDWNRLDISDPSNGRLLTSRGPTSYQQGEERPQHYLDYFHGRLYPSPNGTHMLDDGWVWHPVGAPAIWSVDRWLSENVWESEDGASRRDLCARGYYWDHGATWLGDDTVALSGIGDDDSDMTAGARIFDTTSLGEPRPGWQTGWSSAKEVTAFAGPAGSFFSDGRWLYSTAEAGLFRWDPSTGRQTGHIECFQPNHHHRGARELVQLMGSALLRWSIEQAA
jgi:hypothetical protein